MAYLGAGVAAVFGSDLMILMLPLAVQEMVMAVWLIVKGFDPTADSGDDHRPPPGQSVVNVR